ncbi:hypothetical protein EXIGLDRAFT_249368 [Exidia glandulosa HHB12029]|uniref:Uncharacterized protein n=1 Tax=Exidia glandulosa HHB12029 TaxID=1314781 RepID=A0A165MGM8_EXIGL|nr:hypothetical protein EXIGLDRAFT_249368 [Exidia glandulosa HHB12029]
MPGGAHTPSMTSPRTTTLPVELILAIVDECARHDARAGSQLALVSSAVSREALRALYDVVCLRTWRSTRAFERLLAGAGRSATSGLCYVRHLSAPWMHDTAVSTLGRRCPNLSSLQLLHPPPGDALIKPVELFILAQYSGVIRDTSAFASVHFHSTASLWHEVQSHPSHVLTHFSMTHRLDDHSSGALATVRTILSYPCLEVLVVRLSAVARTQEKMVEQERNVKRTSMWRGLEALQDTRIRAGLYLIHSEQTQTQMVGLWEAHVRETESVWKWGEQVWASDD